VSRLIPLKLRCRHCGCDLSDPDRLIDGFPSVKLKVKVEKGTGLIWLSSLYGSHASESTVDVREGEITTLSCPHCNMLLPEARTCDRCRAPMASISLHLDQGDIKLCRRRGCGNHAIEFSDFNRMKEFYDQYREYLKK
jgi:hypothetical protein